LTAGDGAEQQNRDQRPIPLVHSPLPDIDPTDQYETRFAKSFFIPVIELNW
jgi:hypothetical protein